jgi:hypothetical protein
MAIEAAPFLVDHRRIDQLALAQRRTARVAPVARLPQGCATAVCTCTKSWWTPSTSAYARSSSTERVWSSTRWKNAMTLSNCAAVIPPLKLGSWDAVGIRPRSGHSPGIRCVRPSTAQVTAPSTEG